MNLVKTLLSFSLVSMVSSYSYAGGPLATQKITAVAFNTNGFFLSAADWPNPNNCTKSHAIVLKSTDSNYDKAYALLLMAYTSGKKVQGYSDGCVSHDGQTYNSIRGFKYLTVHD
jgi:hypothetical protein